MHGKQRRLMRGALAVAAAALIVLPAGAAAAAAPATVPIAAPTSAKPNPKGPADPSGVKLGQKLSGVPGSKNAPESSRLFKPPPRPKHSRGNRAVSCASTPLGVCYSYGGAFGYNISPARGAQSTVDVIDPLVRPWDYHSLIELTTLDTNTQNFAEIGIISNDDVCGTGKSPCLFGYHWVNGVGQGYNANFTPAASPPISLGADMSAYVGQQVTLAIDYYDASNGCGAGCTPGQWLSIALPGQALAFIGVFPKTNWSSQGSSYAFPDYMQVFGELTQSQQPSQSKMGNGLLANTTTQGAVVTGYALRGTGAPTGDLDPGANATNPDRWAVTFTSSSPRTSFRYGGPGGTDTIPGSVTADDCPGVGTGSNPSGLGALCTYQTNPSLVPTGKVTSIDGSASTACRGNVGTSAGYAPIRNIAISAFKKVTFWANGTCTGTGTQFNHGRVTLPAGLQAQANLSYRIDSTYATCATGFPTTAPTC